MGFTMSVCGSILYVWVVMAVHICEKEWRVKLMFNALNTHARIVLGFCVNESSEDHMQAFFKLFKLPLYSKQFSGCGYSRKIKVRMNKAIL